MFIFFHLEHTYIVTIWTGYEQYVIKVVCRPYKLVNQTLCNFFNIFITFLFLSSLNERKKGNFFEEYLPLLWWRIWHLDPNIQAMGGLKKHYRPIWDCWPPQPSNPRNQSGHSNWILCGFVSLFVCPSVTFLLILRQYNIWPPLCISQNVIYVRRILLSELH